MTESTVQGVSATVAEVLELGDRGAGLTADTELFGAMPELDSLAVMELITALEERYSVQFDGDDISGETFATIGSLAALVDERIG